MQLNRKINQQNIQHQDGISLVVVIVVLLALTLLALSATNTNNSQGLMVRNSQLRMEAFNASYTEIDAQVWNINTLQLSDGPPAYVLAMIDNPVGTRVDDSTPIPLPQYAPADKKDIEQSVAQEYYGRCNVFGQQVGAGSEKIQCSQLLIDSDSTVVNTAIESLQNQIYEYRTLSE